MVSIRRATLTGVLVVALGAAGCGSSGGGGSLSKGDYVKQADAICGKAAAQVKALGSPNTPDKIATVMPKVSSIFKGMLDDLQALRGPSDLQPDVDKLITAGRKLQDVTGQLAGAAKTLDVPKLTSLQTQLSSAATDAAAAAQKIGFKNCGVSG